MNAPCKDCKDRVLGCHSKCEKYKAFSEENKKTYKKRALLSSIYGDSPNKQRRQRMYQRFKLGGGR
jgi:hypothetical protein